MAVALAVSVEVTVTGIVKVEISVIVAVEISVVEVVSVVLAVLVSVTEVVVVTGVGKELQVTFTSATIRMMTVHIESDSQDLCRSGGDMNLRDQRASNQNPFVSRHGFSVGKLSPLPYRFIENVTPLNDKGGVGVIQPLEERAGVIGQFPLDKRRR